MPTAVEPAPHFTLLTPDVPTAFLDEKLTAEQAARELGISPTAFRKRCQRNWTRYALNGRMYVVSRRWLREALARGQTPISEPSEKAEADK